MFMFELIGNTAQSLIDTGKMLRFEHFCISVFNKTKKNPGESNNIRMHLLLCLMFAKKQLYIFTSQVSRHKQVLFKSSSAVVFLFWLPIC